MHFKKTLTVATIALASLVTASSAQAATFSDGHYDVEAEVDCLEETITLHLHDEQNTPEATFADTFLVTGSTLRSDTYRVGFAAEYENCDEEPAVKFTIDQGSASLVAPGVVTAYPAGVGTPIQLASSGTQMGIVPAGPAFHYDPEWEFAATGAYTVPILADVDFGAGPVTAGDSLHFTPHQLIQFLLPGGGVRVPPGSACSTSHGSASMNRIASFALAVVLLAVVAAPAAAQRTVVDELAFVSPHVIDERLRLGMQHNTYTLADERWSEFADVVVHVPDTARTVLPDDATLAARGLGFLGAGGSTVWTTKIAVADAQAGGNVLFGLRAMPPIRDLPAQLIPYTLLQASRVGEPANAFYYSLNMGTLNGNVVFDSRRTDPSQNRTSISKSSTAIGSRYWTFTASGYYCLTFASSARFADGTVQAASGTVAVAVGDVDPQGAPACAQPTTTSTAVSADQDASGARLGAPIELTATVTPGTASGTVQFYADGTPLGAPVPVASGTARTTASGLKAGRHAFTASFLAADEATNASSSSRPLNLPVYDNFVYFYAHADVASRLVDGELQFGLHETRPGYDVWRGFDDTVLLVGDAARVQVPPDSDYADQGADYTFSYLAPPGSTVWQLPLAPPGPDDSIPWLGVSSESVFDTDYRDYLMWRLDGVSGIDGGPAPGEVIIGGMQFQHPIFSTRIGMPQGSVMPSRGSAHYHAPWTFTAPGVYCTTMTMGSRAALDGRPLSDTRVLTWVVGDDIDPYTQPTCSQRDVKPVGTPAREPATAPAGERYVLGSENLGRFQVKAQLEARLEGDKLAVDLLRRAAAGPGTRHDLHDTVIQVGPSTAGTLGSAIGPNRLPWAGASASERSWELYDQRSFTPGRAFTTLSASTLGIPPGTLAGDEVQWTLKAVRGPGEFILHDYWSLQQSHRALLSNRSGYQEPATTRWVGREDPVQWVFKAPGVYCLDMEWSGTLTGGSELRTARTLTFAVGDIDPTTVVPCGQGGQPTPPVDQPDPGDDDDDGPGGVPSGRTVLKVGHIDISSAVNPTGLQVTVHDDSTVPAATHAPEDVTLFAAPPSRATVPPGSAYAFLGKAGDPVWLLPQTQDPGLLWPGWNISFGTDVSPTAVRWTLEAVRGPGRFTLFQSGGFGEASVLLDATRRSFTYDQHGHGTWAFSSDGVYCLDATWTTEPATIGRSDHATLLVAVGDVDPVVVTERDCGKTAAEVKGEPAPDPIPTPQPTETPVPDLGASTVPNTTPNDPPRPLARAKPALTAIKGVRRVDRKRRVALARLTCPAGARCTIRAPKRIAVRIAGHRHRLKLLAPRTIAAGRRATVRAQLSTAAAKRLAGRRVRVKLKVHMTAAGTTTAHTITATIARRH